MKYSHKNTGMKKQNRSGIFSLKEKSKPMKGKTHTSDKIEMAEKLIKNISEAEIPGGIDVDAAWEKVSSKISVEYKTFPITRPIYLNLLRIAAVFILSIVLGASLYYIYNTISPYRNVVIATGSNEKNKEIILPDGSRVWLNHNSRLTHPAKFNSKIRKVKLAGEGFFEILKQQGNPFVVDAGKARITVTGTSFNVITSNDSGEVEVFVSEGSIIVSGEKMDSIKLEPGYIGITSNKTIHKSLNTNMNYLAWRTDILVYENTRLQDVFNDLKRVYNISVTASDTSIYEKTLTAVFEREPEETIIRIICTTFNLSYVKEGKRVFLSNK